MQSEWHTLLLNRVWEFPSEIPEAIDREAPPVELTYKGLHQMWKSPTIGLQKPICKGKSDNQHTVLLTDACNYLLLHLQFTFMQLKFTDTEAQGRYAWGRISVRSMAAWDLTEILSGKQRTVLNKYYITLQILTKHKFIHKELRGHGITETLWST